MLRQIAFEMLEVEESQIGDELQIFDIEVRNT